MFANIWAHETCYSLRTLCCQFDITERNGSNHGIYYWKGASDTHFHQSLYSWPQLMLPLHQILHHREHPPAYGRDVCREKKKESCMVLHTALCWSSSQHKASNHDGCPPIGWFAVEMQWTGYSRDDHVVMCAVNFSTRISRCDCQRPRHVNEVHKDSQVRHSDHYTVLSSHSAVAFSNSLKDKQRMLEEVYLARHCWNTAYSHCKWLCSICQIKWQDSLCNFRKAAHLIRNPWVQL